MAGVVEMMLAWDRWAIYGRKIAARIAGKTDRPIGGEIAGRMTVVKSVGSIGLIR